MFCFQLRIATENLIHPPTVDSTYERNITDDDIPLITICPTDQTNLTRLKELKYYKVEYFLNGATSCNETSYCQSWGAHANLTFDQVLKQVFDNDKANKVGYGYSFSVIDDLVNIEDRLVFLPKYGICKEISKFNISRKLQVNYFNPSEARVLITDRNYRSYFMPDITSHIGNKIFMKPKKENYVSVKIQVKSYCNDDNEKPMKEDEFKTCVDHKIQNDLEQHIECVPPWLSNKNQCNKTYSNNFFGKFKDKFYQTYTEPISYLLSNIKFEDECKQSCKEITYNVNEGEVANLPTFTNYASTYIAFNHKVVVTEKVKNYSLFQYIIDVGSSLGLWLGLSVLGLHNLIVMAVQFIEGSFIFKKMRSATSK